MSTTSIKIHIKNYFVKLSALILLITWLPYYSQAAFELADEGIVGLSMSNAGCARIYEVEGWNSNPACQWFGSGLNLELSIRKLYGLNELRQNQINLQWKLNNFGVGAELFSFGWKSYFENMYGLTANGRIYKTLIAGIRVNFYELTIAGGGYDNAIGFDLGLIYSFNRFLNYGIVIRNINRPVIGETKDELPYTIQTGISLKPDKLFNFCFDVFKDEKFDPQYRIGIEYMGLNYAVLRFGAALEPVSLSGGLDIKYRFMNIRYAIYNHNQLGLTHVFGIMFRLEGK